MAVSAKLVVLLKANDVEVAHSDDPDLWQHVLLAITGGGGLQHTGTGQLAPQVIPDPGADAVPPDGPNANDPLSRMAGALDIEARVLKGACNPSHDAPFLELDAHCYEAMRRTLPERGATAISKIQLAGTLLGLWFYYASLGNVTQAQAQAVLGGLQQRDRNPLRGLNNADWILVRTGGRFAVNPAEISKAVLIARCFCRKDWSPYLNPA